MTASTDQAHKSRGIMVKELKDYTQLGKSESASFKELPSALFSGDEAITSFKHQSHKIRKKEHPNTVLIQSWFFSSSGSLSYPRTGRMLNVNSSWKRISPPHQLHIRAAGSWVRTSIHRLLRDPSMRRLFKNCGGKKQYVHLYTEGQNAIKKIQNSGN